jgi:hypothetical protein
LNPEKGAPALDRLWVEGTRVNRVAVLALFGVVPIALTIGLIGAVLGLW